MPKSLLSVYRPSDDDNDIDVVEAWDSSRDDELNPSDGEQAIDSDNGFAKLRRDMTDRRAQTANRMQRQSMGRRYFY